MVPPTLDEERAISAEAYFDDKNALGNTGTMMVRRSGMILTREHQRQPLDFHQFFQIGSQNAIHDEPAAQQARLIEREENDMKKWERELWSLGEFPAGFSVDTVEDSDNERNTISL